MFGIWTIFFNTLLCICFHLGSYVLVCSKLKYVWIWLSLNLIWFVFSFGLLSYLNYFLVFFSASVTLVTNNHTWTGPICTSDLHGSCNLPLNRTDPEEFRTDTVLKNQITQIVFLSSDPKTENPFHPTRTRTRMVHRTPRPKVSYMCIFGTNKI